MIALGYPDSPMLDKRGRPSGMRLPNPMLTAPDGSEVRLYDLLHAGPAILDMAEDREHDPEPWEWPVIRIGRGGHRDCSGLLRKLLDNRDGRIVVRLDLHAALARSTPDGLEQAAAGALGRMSPA